MASRWKKEEAKKKAAAREGLSAEEIEALDLQEAEDERLSLEVRTFHAKLFPEEYDFMYDDQVDAKARSQGHNPMSEEYQETVLNRRKSLGFKPLAANGLAQDSESTAFIKRTLKTEGHGPINELIAKYDLDAPYVAKPESLTEDEIKHVLERLREVACPSNNLEECVESLYMFFIGENWVALEAEVIDELKRRFPNMSEPDLKSAYTKFSDWFSSDW